MPRRRARAHPVPNGETNLQIQFHGENAPALPAARKGKSGRVLLRRQRDYPAATVADFCTAVLNGLGTMAIMEATGKSKTTVWRWQERYAEAGVDGLLADKTRPPGKPPISEARVGEVLRLTRDPPPHEATHWTARAMAKAAGLAVATVQKIWKAHGLAPHRWRTF